MFLADYDLTKGIPGAPTAHLKLAVDPLRKTFSGTVRISQAVPNPYDPMEVNGSYFEQPHLGLVISVRSTAPVVPGKPEFSSVFVTKNWGGRIPIAMVYPNSYYIGMSNLAMQTVICRRRA